MDSNSGMDYIQSKKLDMHGPIVPSIEFEEPKFTSESDKILWRLKNSLITRPKATKKKSKKVGNVITDLLNMNKSPEQLRNDAAR